MQTQKSRMTLAFKLFTVLLPSLIGLTPLRAKITVVNMTPAYFSDEINNDNEPNLAVNPNNPLMIAATAFTTYPACGNSKAPIYFSSDGGQTWDFRCIMPASAPGTCPGTCDVTLRFASPRKQPDEGNNLYIGLLTADPSFHLSLIILRSGDLLNATPIASRSATPPNAPDQPYIQVVTARASALPQDRIFMGLNDLEIGIPPTTATVEETQDGSTTNPTFSSPRVETLQRPCRQDAPSVRPAIHSDGTIYAAFLRWTKCDSLPILGDVVVVRDDSWGSGSNSFTSLKDAHGAVGVSIKSGVTFPFNTKLGGTQRVGSQLSVAVSPQNSKVLYVAWGDGTTAANHTIHVAKTDDRGANWNITPFSVRSATNPAISVDAKGDVGLLYQSLAQSDRWETHIVLTKDDFTSKIDKILATVPNDRMLNVGLAGPLGDYADLTSVGTTFYGIFSAYNIPDKNNFPQGVVYQRKHTFDPPALLNDQETTVVASIDPFFFAADASKLLNQTGLSPQKKQLPLKHQTQ